jgi:hypothetical protein
MANIYFHSGSNRKKHWILPLNIVAFICGLAAIYMIYLLLDAME